MGTEQTSEYYDKHYQKKKAYQKIHYRDFGRFPLWQTGLSYINKNFDSPDISILEIGCGSGQFAAYLWDYGYRHYLGTDFSSVAIDMCQKLISQKFKKEDCFKSIKREYDIVLAMEILEHLEKDLELLKMIPTGKKIVFSVPKFDEASHVRHFPKLEDVLKRYDSIIKIEEHTEFSKWFVICGERV